MVPTGTGLLHTTAIQLCPYWHINAIANILYTKDAELLVQPWNKEHLFQLGAVVHGVIELYCLTFTLELLRWSYREQHCRTKGTATATYLPPSGPPLPLINSSDKLTSKSSSRRQQVETPIQLWLVNTPYSVTTSTGNLSVVWSFKDDRDYPRTKNLLKTVTATPTLTTWPHTFAAA